MINVKTANTQEVRAAVEKAISEFTDTGFVTVGIHEDTGEHPNAGITNAALGAVLHYGNDRIPARPFLDVGVQTEEKLYAQIVIDTAKSGGTLEDALKAIGVTAQAAVQIYMTNLRSPPNAPETIKRKGSSNPLINWGDLKGSIKHKVVVKKPQEGLS